MEVIELSRERKEPPPRTSSWKCWCKTPAEAAGGRVGVLSPGEGVPPARSVPLAKARLAWMGPRWIRWSVQGPEVVSEG